jgi:uncharacterized protein YeaO (DUF488 family)
MVFMEIRIKRAYDKAAGADGRRVLVDRLWPRGVRKETARIDYWARDLAPSAGLRKWFAHDPDRWDGFRRRYFRELDTGEAALAAFREAVAGARRVTLVYGARDEEHNNAVALAEYLRARS